MANQLKEPKRTKMSSAIGLKSIRNLVEVPIAASPRWGRAPEEWTCVTYLTVLFQICGIERVINFTEKVKMVERRFGKFKV